MLGSKSNLAPAAVVEVSYRLRAEPSEMAKIQIQQKLAEFLQAL